MNVRRRGAARRYARALLDVALDQGDADRVRAQLRDVVDVLAAAPGPAAALAHPALALERKQAVAREVLGSAGLERPRRPPGEPAR